MEDPLKPDAAGTGLKCPTVCTGAQKCCKVGQQNFCVDTSGDTMNCGDCGASCNRQQATGCAAGKCKCGAGPACDASHNCCPQGGGAAACLDLKNDNNNCGTCGHMCPAGSVCHNGGCVCAGTNPCTAAQTCCGSGCADTNTDDNNCGACDTKCGDAHCAAGQCVCHIAIVPGVIYTDDTCADFTSGALFGPKPDCCGNSCVDLKGDAANCGACGNQCPPGFLGFPACSSGVCF